MNYATQISTSGVLGALYRQDVATNNLANLNTPGFKPDMPQMHFREAARVEDDLFHLPSDELLEKLGAGVKAGPNTVVFKQGAVSTTGNPLDVAIQGEGFFSVLSGDETRLSRDGRFTMDADGVLRSAASGWAVLDDGGSPIELDPRLQVAITPTGEVMQGGAEVAKIGLVDVADRTGLTKLGDGTFAFEPAIQLTEATGSVVQGALESAAVDEIKALLAVTNAAGGVRSNIGMMTYQDRLMDQAINTFGRVG
ncbi:MAG: flagellar hook-basal body protein [Planctomycetota bacterium]